MTGQRIYHICQRTAWEAARREGAYRGSDLDLRDGFIHFSTAAQAVETAKVHLAGQDGLVLLEVDPAPLGDALRWEVSRGGQAFPHLYAALPVEAVIAVHDLPLGPDGRHIFPPL